MGSTVSCLSTSANLLVPAVEHDNAELLQRHLKHDNRLLLHKSLGPEQNTAWHVAASSGCANLLSALYGDLASRTDGALQQQLQKGHKNSPFDRHVAIQSTINRRNYKGKTALMLACAAGHVPCVKQLMSMGADPWLQDLCGRRSALHYAAMSGNVGCVKALIDGVPAAERMRIIDGHRCRLLDMRTVSGFTPLHSASFCKHPEVVRLLLEYGANLGAATTIEGMYEYTPCPKWSTPLHISARLGDEATVMVALQYYLAHMDSGREVGDPRCRTNIDGHSPGRIASLYGHSLLAELLHPLTDLEALFDQVEKVGVPRLAILAASVLRRTLMSMVDVAEGKGTACARQAPPAAVSCPPAASASAYGFYTANSDSAGCTTGQHAAPSILQTPSASDAVDAHDVLSLPASEACPLRASPSPPAAGVLLTPSASVALAVHDMSSTQDASRVLQAEAATACGPDKGAGGCTGQHAACTCKQKAGKHGAGGANPVQHSGEDYAISNNKDVVSHCITVYAECSTEGSTEGSTAVPACDSRCTDTSNGSGGVASCQVCHSSTAAVQPPAGSSNTTACSTAAVQPPSSSVPYAGGSFQPAAASSACEAHEVCEVCTAGTQGADDRSTLPVLPGLANMLAADMQTPDVISVLDADTVQLEVPVQCGGAPAVPKPMPKHGSNIEPEGCMRLFEQHQAQACTTATTVEHAGDIASCTDTAQGVRSSVSEQLPLQPIEALTHGVDPSHRFASFRAGLRGWLRGLGRSGRTATVVSTTDATTATPDEDAVAAKGFTQCFICLEDTQGCVVLLPCKHRLCAPCMRRLVSTVYDKALVCPVCRQVIKGCEAPHLE